MLGARAATEEGDECAAGLHGANRLGGNSLSDLLVFGKRAGSYAAAFAKANKAGSVNEAQVKDAAQSALAPFERRNVTEGPYQVQIDLQQHMQTLVGIVRNEGEMLQALEILGTLRDRAERVCVAGNREYNGGWHTALDLANLLTVSQAITLAGLERKESRGAHFREDYPDKVSSFGTFNIVIRKGSNGKMTVARQAIPDMPAELKKVIDENK